MEIVRVTAAHELSAEDQRFCDATKAWFRIDFVPKMSRVLLTVPEFGRAYGRASRRAMADGALRRGAASAAWDHLQRNPARRRFIPEISTAPKKLGAAPLPVPPS